MQTAVSCRYIGQNYEQEIRMEWGHIDKSFELAVAIAPDSRDFIAEPARVLDSKVSKTAYTLHGYQLSG